MRCFADLGQLSQNPGPIPPIIPVVRLPWPLSRRDRRFRRSRSAQSDDRVGVLRRLLPSMYHRRLALLTLAFFVPFGAVMLRVGYLTTVKADELTARAERALLRSQWTPTVRGRILDRHGRALALDRPSFEVRVEYEMISGEWARREAERHARERHRDVWSTLDGVGRERLASRYRPMFDDELEQMWSLLGQLVGVDQDEVQRRRAAVLENVQRIAASQWERARVRREREILENTGREVSVELRAVARPIAEQRRSHALFRSVSDSVALDIRRLADNLPGVSVYDAGLREYPFETMTVEVPLRSMPLPLRSEGSKSVVVRGVGTHVLGWMRDDVHAEDVARRPRFDPQTGAIDRGFYDAQRDRIGHTGIEASQEDRLRGLRGVRLRHLDTGEVETTEPSPGEDVRLTIDIALQARVQAAMSPELGLTLAQPWHDNPDVPDGARLNGAAVVLDLASGEILALVTTPSFTRHEIRDDPRSIFLDRINMPWIDRATEAIYPPGSVVKAMILVGAIQQGVHRLDKHIECTGHLLPGRTDLYRCWIYKRFGQTHSGAHAGGLSGQEALAVSCNIYFYTLGRALGPKGIERLYREYGLGETFGLGIGPEAPGVIGSLGSGAINPSDAILMGMGQGPVAWTPLHAADAMATLARGGLRLSPRIVADEAPRATDLRLDPSAVREAMRGLWRSVNDPIGTGTRLTFDGRRDLIFNAPGVDVWGKTGTADAPPLVVDPDGDGPMEPMVVRSGDHSWFVVLAGPKGKDPRYVISVMMEYGGSGGKVSGPIANQIVHALVAEGYLPGGPERAPTPDPRASR